MVFGMREKNCELIINEYAFLIGGYENRILIGPLLLRMMRIDIQGCKLHTELLFRYRNVDCVHTYIRIHEFQVACRYRYTGMYEWTVINIQTRSLYTNAVCAGCL